MQPLLQCTINKYYVFQVCTCSLMHPACNVNAPYYHLQSAWPYNTFPNHLIKDTIKKKVIDYKMCILIFSTIMSETFLILWWTEWDMVKNVHWSSHKTPVILVQFLMKSEFSQHIFKKIQKYQISWKSVHWEPSCSMQTHVWMDGQTNGHDKANSHFCNFGNALNL